MIARNLTKLICVVAAAQILAACTREQQPASPTGPASMKEVPAVRLNYRYEPDVPAPVDTKRTAVDERNAAVQASFDQNRPNELLDKTLPSPDGKRILAVYHQPTDTQAEFRLDMYSAEGKLLAKVSADSMAVHFPDTIVWSPDSSTAAFVAMTRGASALTPTPTPPDAGDIAPKSSPTLGPDAAADSNSNTAIPESTDPEANANADLPPAPATPAPPADVLTFRTEQIYICNADGSGVKPLTQNEGLIYFYYVWSPDSSMLAALAATGREWQVFEYQANERKEQYVPVGRPRVIEKNGRERRLDDARTAVQPVWSPDSAKVSCAFNDQVRIYDSRGDVPTQAAIPLRNSLLLSSAAYDRDQAGKLNAAPDANSNANANTSSNVNANGTPSPNLPPSALPDPSKLVSFNPIVALNWLTEDQLYFETAFVKRMKNDADSLTSFPRWHRLILTPQPAAVNK